MLGILGPIQRVLYPFDNHKSQLSEEWGISCYEENSVVHNSSIFCFSVGQNFQFCFQLPLNSSKLTNTEQWHTMIFVARWCSGYQGSYMWNLFSSLHSCVYPETHSPPQSFNIKCLFPSKLPDRVSTHFCRLFPQGPHSIQSLF